MRGVLVILVMNHFIFWCIQYNLVIFLALVAQLCGATYVVELWSASDCSGSSITLSLLEFQESNSVGRNDYFSWDWCHGRWSDGKEMKSSPKTFGDQGPKPQSLKLLDPAEYVLDAWHGFCHDNYGYASANPLAI